MTVRLDFLRRALLASAAGFLPAFRTALVLLLLGGAVPPVVSAAVGLGGSVLGTTLVLAAGITVTTLRACLPSAIGDPDAAVRARRAEVRSAAAASCVFAALGAGVLAAGIATGAHLFVTYWLCLLPTIVLAPVSAVISGAFQATNRDGVNLATALIGTLAQVAVTAGAVGVGAPPLLTVALIGATSSVTALVGTVVRGRQVMRAGLFTAAIIRGGLADAVRQPVAVLRGLGERAAAAVDGLVFMVAFTAAVLVASADSPGAGATVALTVALMRSVVVPVKQFGSVGARFVLQERGRPDPISLRTVQANSALVLILAALALVLARVLVPSFSLLIWPIVLAMVAQLLLEPWAGVLFAFRKLTESTASGLVALLVAYGGVAAAGLAALAVVGRGSAGPVWATLFAARLVFVVLQLPGARRRRG